MYCQVENILAVLIWATGVLDVASRNHPDACGLDCNHLRTVAADPAA